MVLVYKSGPMEQGTRVTGLKIKLRVEVLFGMQMETCMKVNFIKTETMDLEVISARMVLSLKGCGKMMFSMERGQHTGLMVLTIKEIILKAVKKVMGSMFGLMEIHFKENGKLIKSKDLELTLG